MALLPKKNADSAEPKPPKEKRELTDEQKKMRNMLIVVGVLAVITAAIYVPGMFASKPSPPVAMAPETEGTPSAEPGQTPAAGATPQGEPGQKEPAKEETPKPEPTKEAPASGTAKTKTGLLVYGKPVASFRRDPFEPFYSGIVVPDPTPTPIPSVPIPMPRPGAPIPRPGSRFGNGADVSNSEDIQGLPPVHISRISETTTIPQVTTPFKRTTGKLTTSNVTDVAPAENKRLSGVIIGDGIRALLEINKGDTIVTRVVQPGDEVDGILVLSIQRVTVGNQTVTRMLVRENNEDKYVDLKPSDTKTTTQQPGGGTG